MKKILFFEIHPFLALLMIFSVALVPASIGIFVMYEPSPPAQAIIGSDISIDVLSIPVKCVQDELSPTCTQTCTFCGDLAGICNGMFEVKARYINGVNLLHNSALCLVTPTILQNSFQSGARCKGKVIGAGPHILYNFGCGKI